MLSFRTAAERYMGSGEQDSLRQSELVCTRCGEQLLEVAKRSQELCTGRGEGAVLKQILTHICERKETFDG
jgi:hypothetical protein